MRNFARFTTSLYRDPDFTSLTFEQQGVYFMLGLQPEVTAAGTLALTTGRWSRHAANCNRRELEELIVALEHHAGRHLVVDEDTEELLIRKFIKWDGGWSNSKRLPVVIEAVKAIVSVHIRDIAVEELRRIGSGIPHNATEKLARDAVSLKVEEYVSSFDRKKATVKLGDHNALDLNPNPQPGAVPVAADAGDSPPSMFCEQHPNGTTDPCGACARAREVYSAWVAGKLERDVTAQRLRRQAIDDCGLCDEHGKRVDGSGRILARVCDHSASVSGSVTA